MRLLSTLFLTLFTLVSATAQPRVLTLDEVKRLSLEQNLTVVQAQNNLSTTESQVLAARGQWFPTLSASGGWSRSQQQSTGTEYQNIGGVIVPVSGGKQTSNSFNSRISASWLIFDAFGRESDNSSASSRAAAAELGFTRTRQSVVFQAVSDYLNVLRMEQLVKASEENLKRDRRQLERITESNRVGALSLADVYRQQSQVAADELALINAQNNFNKAKADLMSFLGMSMFEEVEVADATIPVDIDSTAMLESMEISRDFATLTRRALEARPDYQRAAQTLEASKSDVTSAKSGYFPSLSTSAGYSRSGVEMGEPFKNIGINWGINLSWNLFDGFRTNVAVQGAIASRRNAEIQLAQTERDINVEVKKALLDLEASRKSYEASQKGLISATEDRKIAEERYNLGAGTLLDLLTANAGFINAQVNKVNAVYGFLTSKYNLEYAIGERAY
jgi:outer membrane protein